MKFRKNGAKIAWGVFFILAAVYLIVSRVVELPQIGVVKVILTLFLAWLFIHGLWNVNFWEILFPIAFLCILFEKELGITQLTPGPVLGAALLGSIGLSMVFKKKKKNSWSYSSGASMSASAGEQCSGEHIRIENNFGSSIKYVNSDNFCNAELENSFGAMTVYFDNAIIQGGMAYINISNSFGETVLYIPKEWNTVNYLDHSFGAINEVGKSVGSSAATLNLRGDTSFGHIEIHYI